MNIAFFIARRLARPSPDNRPGVMVRIAVVAVALSVAVMILALAVILGFKREVTRKVTGFAAHVEVTDLRSVHALASEPVVRSEELEEVIRSVDGYLSAAPYALKGGILRSAEGMQGVMLKGVDGAYDWSFLSDHLTRGELPRVGDTVRTKDILLSQGVAERLRIGVGDKVEMLFVDRGESLRRDRFKVAGLYATGMEEMDDRIVVTDLRNVQRLSGWDSDRITGYEIRTDDISRVGLFTRDLNRALLYADFDGSENLAATSVEELYPQVFDWLRTHDVNAAVIIGIMLAVALFNMTSALLILVLERTRMIGLLKTMGMADGTLQRLFLYRAAFIVVRGVAWGNAVGIGLCLIQRYFHPVKLDSAGYLLSEVPIWLDWGWWLVLNAAVVAVIVILLALPTYMISYIKPDEAIRYD